MLRWCAYCQEFQGEVAPFDDLNTTHGMCPSCKAKGYGRLDEEMDNSKRLREIQEQLRIAGQRGDMEAAPQIVRTALAAGLRPVDILIGLITPLLYLIGSEWESGIITVADEHRFTRFCECVFELIKLEVKAAGGPALGMRHAPVFLMAARGNHHTLGVRMLALWLKSKGVETIEFDQPPSPEDLVVRVAESRPAAIMISVSLDRQQSYVYRIAQRIAMLAEPRPILFVGGYAIKRHLIPPIPGTIFLESMTGLNGLIANIVDLAVEPLSV